MDSASAVPVTARVINITGCTIKATDGKNTLEVKGGGAVSLTGTKADASDKNLVYSNSGGTVKADNSQLTGKILNTGDDALNITLDTKSTFKSSVTTNTADATNLTVSSHTGKWVVSNSSDLGAGNLINGGGVDFTANGVGFTDSVGDDWLVYGIGFASRINDRNSVHLDLERSSDHVFEQSWGVKAGWRVEF